MSMNVEYILRKENKVFKPVSLKTLRTWVYESRVGTEDMISADGGKTWTLAGKIPELTPFFPSQTPFLTEVTRGYSGKVERKRKSIEIIDMIPMIDMVFLLLIFFALTSTFEIQRVMEMNLPKATSGRQLQQQQTLTLYIKKDNQVLLENKPIDLQDLQGALHRTIQNSTGVTLVIKGDAQVPHGNVVQVMDIANTAGVDKILITVKKQGP